MIGRWNRTVAIAGMVAGAFTVGVVVAHRPTTVAAERDDKEAEAGKVGYVHIQRVLWESARAKSHGKALAEVRKKYDERLADLREKSAASERIRPVVARPDEGYEAGERPRDPKRELSDTEAEARREFDTRADRLLGEMYKEVAVVSAELAREYGLDAVQTYPIAPGTIDLQQQKGVLSAPSALLYVRRDADLTDEVIRRLDKRFASEVGTTDE
jgi:Skp family chaperone for outer membrane proteins